MPTDLDRLQGAWTVTALEADGHTMPETALGEARIIINRSAFTSTGMGATYTGTIEIDSSKSPKTMDLLFTAGPQKGTRNRGIYRLDDDRWTICLATYGPKRPDTFATRAGTGIALETLEREGAAKAKSPKPKRAAIPADKKPEPDPAISGAPTELEGEWPMVSAVLDGVPMDQNMVQWCKRVTRGNLTTVLAGPQMMLKAAFTLDKSRAPHAIDYVNLAGPSKGKPQAGIYESSGGTLKICMAAPGKSRPKEFSSKPGDGRSYTTWRST